MILNNTIFFARIGIIFSKTPKNEVIHFSYLYLLHVLNIIFGFEIDLLKLHMTVNHQTNNRNRLSWCIRLVSNDIC